MEDAKEKDTSVQEVTNNVAPANNGDKIKKIAKSILESIKNFAKKDFGKVKGLHILVAAVVLVLVFICLTNGCSKGIEYRFIYGTSDRNLMIIGKKATEDKAVKLSGDDYPSTVVYANTSNRYVLFKKNEGLYLYDAKRSDETTKITSSIKSGSYFFTEDDKYVVALDLDNNLYAYNFKKDKEKIDSDVLTILDYTKDKVLYTKTEGTVYVKSINPKKDDRVKIAEKTKSSYTVPRISADGKTVLYIDEDGDLQQFNVKKDKKEKIASDVTAFYVSKEGNLDKFYYVVNDDGETVVYYYNGKDGEKVVSDINVVVRTNVAEQQLFYTVANGDKYDLVYKKGTKDAVKVEEDLKSTPTSFEILDGKAIYYVNSSKEVRYAKINGAKIGSVSTVEEDFNGAFIDYKGGYAFVAQANKDGSGDLFVAKNGKAKKIDSDVKYSNILVNTDGTRLYYLKDYSKSSGDLYYSNGGKGKKIDSDVHDFSYINDDLMYYIKDYSNSKDEGTLYRYTGKSKKISEEASRMVHIPQVSYSHDK